MYGRVGKVGTPPPPLTRLYEGPLEPWNLAERGWYEIFAKRGSSAKQYFTEYLPTMVEQKSESICKWEIHIIRVLSSQNFQTPVFTENSNFY